MKRLMRSINPWQEQSQKEKAPRSDNRNEKGVRSTNNKDFQRIIKGYNELFYAAKFNTSIGVMLTKG